MKLGENILKLRKEKGLSQEELAEKLNVTRQTISNWELGETQPTPSQLKVLSKIFQISIDKILDNDIENSLVDKVSNTEKLAGTIIRILKGIGIAFVLLLIIDVISLVFFTIIRKEAIESVTEEATINCSMNNQEYLITVGSDLMIEYFTNSGENK